jgi:hypothetical protein
VPQNTCCANRPNNQKEKDAKTALGFRSDLGGQDALLAGDEGRPLGGGGGG